MESALPFVSQERTECRALGTVKASEAGLLRELLVGLAGFPGQDFKHHEVVLSSIENPPVNIRLVRDLDGVDSALPSSNAAVDSRRWS